MTLKVHDEFNINQLQVKVSLDKFLTRWVKFLGNLPLVLPPQPVSARHKDYQFDFMRSTVFHGLIEHEKVYAHLNEKSLSFLMFPHGIASETIIAKGALKLAPLVPLSNIFAEKKSNSVSQWKSM